MNTNKKIILVLIGLIILSWVGNIMFYFKHKIGDEIAFNYSYEEGTWFLLSYIKDQESSGQVVSISFPELSDFTIPIKDNAMNFLNYENNDSNIKKIIGNTRYEIKNIGIMFGNGFYPDGKEFVFDEIVGKELTKIKYKTSSGLERECEIGGLVIKSAITEGNGAGAVDGVAKNESELYKCNKANVNADRVAEREYTANEDIELYELEGRYKNQFLETYNIEINGEVLKEGFDSINIDKGEEFKIITKAKSDSAINPMFGTEVNLKVKKIDGSEENVIEVGIYNTVNREQRIFKYKEVDRLLKARGIK